MRSSVADRELVGHDGEQIGGLSGRDVYISLTLKLAKKWLISVVVRLPLRSSTFSSIIPRFHR